MVGFREATGSKPIDGEWHRKGREAKENTFSLNEWSEQEIIRWDLDTETRIPTGRENPRTYTTNRPIDTLGENGTDIRTLDDR